jgi:hypothetical protein
MNRDNADTIGPIHTQYLLHYIGHGSVYRDIVNSILVSDHVDKIENALADTVLT